jgi:DNA mismatch repair ATPase MutS
VSPSASVKEINERLDLVTEMLAFTALRQDITNLLRATFDTWRLLQKFSFSKGVADDLVSLAQTVQTTANIRNLLRSYEEYSGEENKSQLMSSLNNLVNRLELTDVVKLSEDILEAIDQEQLSQQHSFEDDEAAATAQMAEQVLKDAGEGEKLPGMPQRVRARLAAGTKEKDTDLYSDVWIMRPRYGINSMVE